MADRANGIVVDTSVVIAHLRGRIDIFGLTSSDEPLFLPLVALGELYKGALRSARISHNRQLVDDFLGIVSVLHPGTGTAETYAKTAVGLEAKGNVIPENDIWIASMALECDMPLATRDAHFERINGLSLIKW